MYKLTDQSASLIDDEDSGNRAALIHTTKIRPIYGPPSYRTKYSTVGRQIPGRGGTVGQSSLTRMKITQLQPKRVLSKTNKQTAAGKGAQKPQKAMGKQLQLPPQ